MEESEFALEEREGNVCRAGEVTGRGLALWAFLLALCGGCTSIDLTSLRTEIAPEGGVPIEMAVIAEREMANAEGRAIAGVVAQLVFLDQAGHAIPFEGEISLAVFAGQEGKNAKVEPERQWKFTREEVVASRASSAVGVVHKFWIPLAGPLEGEPKLEMLSLATEEKGRQFSQWNRLTNVRPKSTVETTSDADQAETDGRDEERAAKSARVSKISSRPAAAARVTR